MNIKDILLKDSNGQWHGYALIHNGLFVNIRITFKHGEEIGYEEWHEMKQTTFYIR